MSDCSAFRFRAGARMRTQAGSSRPLRALLPLLLLVLALCLSSSSCLLSSAQSFGDLRLLRMDLDPYRSEYYPGDASQPPTWSRGLLQVFNSSSAPGAADGWGTVCNDIFDQDDLGADVVCRQLGWPARAATYGRIWTVNSSRWVTTTNPGAASLTIMLDSVSCDGTESRLVDCSHDPLGVSDCRVRTHARTARANLIACEGPSLQYNSARLPLTLCLRFCCRCVCTAHRGYRHRLLRWPTVLQWHQHR